MCGYLGSVHAGTRRLVPVPSWQSVEQILGTGLRHMALEYKGVPLVRVCVTVIVRFPHHGLKCLLPNTMQRE